MPCPQECIFTAASKLLFTLGGSFLKVFSGLIISYSLTGWGNSCCSNASGLGPIAHTPTATSSPVGAALLPPLGAHGGPLPTYFFFPSWHMAVEQVPRVCASQGRAESLANPASHLTQTLAHWGREWKTEEPGLTLCIPNIRHSSCRGKKRVSVSVSSAAERGEKGGKRFLPFQSLTEPKQKAGCWL